MTGFERVDALVEYSEDSTYLNPIVAAKMVEEKAPDIAYWYTMRVIAGSSMSLWYAADGASGSFETIKTLFVRNTHTTDTLQLGYFDAANGPAGSVVTTVQIPPGKVFFTQDCYCADQGATIRVKAGDSGPIDARIYVSGT